MGYNLNADFHSYYAGIISSSLDEEATDKSLFTFNQKKPLIDGTSLIKGALLISRALNEKNKDGNMVERINQSAPFVLSRQSVLDSALCSALSASTPKVHFLAQKTLAQNPYQSQPQNSKTIKESSFNALPLISDSIFSSPNPQKTKTPIILESQLQTDPTLYNNCPGGITTVFTLPYQFIDDAQILAKTQDKEEIREKVVTLTQKTFSLVNALGYLALNVIWVFSKIFENIEINTVFWKIVEEITVVFGLVVAVIEFILEIVQLRRVGLLWSDDLFLKNADLEKIKKMQNESKEKQLELLSSLIKKMEDNKNALVKLHGSEIYDNLLQSLKDYKSELENSKPNFQNLEAKILYLELKSFDQRKLKPKEKEIIKLQRNLKISPEKATEEALKLKLNLLAKRISPFWVEKLQKDLQSLLPRISSKDPLVRMIACVEAKRLINNLDIQIRKAIIVHIVALFCLAVVIAALILALVALYNPLSLPFTALPTILFWGGFGLLLLKYIFASGFLNTIGYQFSWYHATSWLQSGYETAKDKTTWVCSSIKSLATKTFNKLSREPSLPIAKERIRAFSI